MRSLQKKKPEQQWLTLLQSLTFSIFTTIKQPRAADGHGREYTMREKKQLRAFHAQFQAVLRCRKAIGLSPEE